MAKTKSTAASDSGVDPTTVKGALGNVAIEFDQIQGNIFGGFSKDHQVTILLEIQDVAKAKAALKHSGDPDTPPDANDSILTHVHRSSSEAVLAFNEAFHALRRDGSPEGSIQATWTNLVFTARGMKKLSSDLEEDLEQFPEAFKGTAGGAFQGMVGRAGAIGDIGENDPSKWNQSMDVVVDWSKVDAAILVGSDDPVQVSEGAADGRVVRYLKTLRAAGSGVTVLGVIHGETRVDEVGHEHFGFKDGVSQPGVRGVTAPDDPLHNPNQGNPGQDLLQPGEFVLGYPRQIPVVAADGTTPNPSQGIVAGEAFYTTDPAGSQTVLPSWAKNGSFLVFRRLAQDVKNFRDSVDQIAATLKISSDLLGAKIVGRYRSGAPLEALKFQAGIGEYQPPMTDPGIAKPATANNDSINNDFEYADDDQGEIVPLAAHIRKAYPRDQSPLQEDGKTFPPNDPSAESRTQTHRLLRRGIPFGKSLGAPEGGKPADPRGLLFFAYQTDIERQFEFVQRAWVDDPDFPQKNAGQDPIITNNTAAGPIAGCPFHKKADASQCPVSFKHFVATRGGQYFFSPSISTLTDWLG